MSSYLLIILALQIAQADASHASAPQPSADTAVAETTSTVDANTSAAVSQLLDQLGDADFNNRELAQSKLQSLTEAQIEQALPQIARRYHDTHDAEIRMRLRRFGDDCFDRLVLPRYDQLHQRGFLGVTVGRATLGDGTPAVVVTDVLAASPALIGGFQRGDLITHIDDKGLDERDAVGSFINSVQQHHAGMRVQFSVRRGNATLPLTVILAPLPEQYRDTRAVERRKVLIERLREQWWQVGMLKGTLHPTLAPPDDSVPMDPEPEQPMIIDD